MRVCYLKTKQIQILRGMALKITIVVLDIHTMELLICEHNLKQRRTFVVLVVKYCIESLFDSVVESCYDVPSGLSICILF